MIGKGIIITKYHFTLSIGTLDYCQRELKLKMQEKHIAEVVIEADGGDFCTHVVFLVFTKLFLLDDDDDDDEHVGNDESDDDDSSYQRNHFSRNVLKRPANGFSTRIYQRRLLQCPFSSSFIFSAALKRSNKTNNHQSRTFGLLFEVNQIPISFLPILYLDRSLERTQSIHPVARVARNHHNISNTHQSYQGKVSGMKEKFSCHFIISNQYRVES